MREPFQKNGESYVEIASWVQDNEMLVAGFTTRENGVSEIPYASMNLGLHTNDSQSNILKNREILSEQLHMDLNQWVQGEQIHAANIKLIDEEDIGKGSKVYETAIKNVDGLITKQRNVLLTAVYADCVPLYFYDPIHHYIGIAHAGWRGTVGRIAEKMTQYFISLGTDVKDLKIAIGPSIGKDQYEVDENVISHIDDHFKAKTVTQLNDHHYLLDLKQLNKEILLQNDVLASNIEITSYCTMTHQELFFSHRRDNGKTGRMLGFIGFRE